MEGQCASTLGSLKPVKTGKVREIYDVGDFFLFVATDRISAYDVVLPTSIPDKGKVLNQISRFWFEKYKDLMAHHYVSDAITEKVPDLKPFKDSLQGRSMLVKKAEVIPVECVVRGYLTGSGWKEYLKDQTVTGISLPAGILESQKLEAPLFTPATKAETGHDENIPFEIMVDKIGLKDSERLRELSLKLYGEAAAYLETKGIILADTKFEFGWHNGEILLIDEVLTPDSSRFWPKDSYVAGRGQDSFDKQFVRDYLNSIQFNRQYPGPELPQNIVTNTRDKYLEIYERITEQALVI